MILTIAAERDHWKREAEALRAQIEGLTVERNHYRVACENLRAELREALHERKERVVREFTQPRIGQPWDEKTNGGGE